MASSLTGNQMKDPALKKFYKTNLYHSNNPYEIFQDPTFLGFKLLFFFNQPNSRLLCSKTGYSNTALSYLESIGDSYRAGLLTKFVNHLQEINKQVPWFFQSIEGLDEAWKRGFQNDEFSAKIPKDRKISIECLESIDLRMTALMDLYRKSCFDWNFRREVVPFNLRTFTVYVYVYENRNINRSGLPSPSGLLDLNKLLGLNNINAQQQKNNEDLLGADLFGDTDKRSPLTQLEDRGQNLIDGIKSDPLKGIKSALSPSGIGNETADTINPNINRYMFEFTDCEWLPDESNIPLSKISNITGEPISQKIVFSYKNVQEVNLNNIYSGDTYIKDTIINLLDQSTTDVKIQEANRTMYGKINTGADPTQNPSYGITSVLNPKYNAILPYASLLSDKINRLISSYAGKLLLGNVYGFSALNTVNAVGGILSGDPTSVVSGASTLVGELRGSASKHNDSHHNRMGNVYK